MAKTIQQLREERNAKAKEYHNILDNNPGKLTEEETKKLDELTADITAIDDRIEREQKILDLESERLASEHFQGAPHSIDDELSPERAIFNKWLTGGDRALSAEDWQVIRNTMSTGTDAEGGYTVDTETAKVVLNALKAYGGMRNVCTVIQMTQGNPLNYPTSDGTSETGELLDENTQASDLDASFGVKTLPVYKFSSKVVTVPIELLQDSAVNIEAFVNARLSTRLGRVTNTYFTTGTGASQPQGIVPAVTVGATGAAGEVTSIIYDDLVNLEHSVDPAYRTESCKWMFNDAMLKVIKKLKDLQNRPLWIPDIAGNAPASICGYGYQINQDIAVPAASAKSMLFGDFSKYVIRDVMSLTYFRFTDSAYAKKGQVGFLAFMRSGGNFMDVGGAIKCFQHPAA